MQLLRSLGSLLVIAASAVALAVPATEAGAEIIPGKYIVELKPGIDASAVSNHHATARTIHRRNTKRDEGGIEKTYQIKDYNAYAGSFDQATVNEIAKLPEVLSVHPDMVVYPAKRQPSVKEKRALVTQSNAPWGLGRLSHRASGSTEYVYDSSAGEGTTIYVLDTGLRTTHVEFEGRATFGYNAVSGTPNNTEEIVHGTPVASIAAGKTFGVAKKAKVIGVKLFGPSGSTSSTVLDGFNWAVNDMVSNKRVNSSVINMSIEGAATSVYDNALKNAYNLGIFSVVAAGNDWDDASRYSPANSPYVLTVGNLAQHNSRHFSSNWGPAVDIFAPGENIQLAKPSSDTAVGVETGTSEATPCVAGLVAYLKALEKPQTLEQLRKRILDLATKDLVTDTKGSPNLIVYNGAGVGK